MSIVVYAPASTANVSVGFDVLGGALTPIDGSPLGDRVRSLKVITGFHYNVLALMHINYPMTLRVILFTTVI